MRIVFLLAFSVMLVSSAKAGIVLTIVNKSFDSDSGVQLIDVFARTSNPTTETTKSISADFTLSRGVFVENNNGFGFASGINPPASEKRTGIVGSAGMLAAGNIFGGSFFVFDSSDPKFAVLSLDLIADQPVTVTDQRLLQLTVNVNGLAPGNYGIDVAGGTNVVGGTFGFSITAVPEPGSLLLLSTVGIAIGGWYRVRRKVATAHKDL